MKRLYSWFRGLFRRVPVPIDYASHAYQGLDSALMLHEYRVTFRRGKDTIVKTYRLHAAQLNPRPHDKLVQFFTQEARKL